MYNSKQNCIKDIFNELNQRHKQLMTYFPRFSIDSCIIHSSGNEVPILRIRIHHHQVLSHEPFCSDVSNEWGDVIDKFEYDLIRENDMVFLVFTTPEDFEASLIPKRILIFTQNYSESNKFQIQHHILITSNL